MEIDWISTTLLQGSIDENLDSLRVLLGEQTLLERGAMGYESAAVVLGTGRIFWSRRHPEMGVHVSLPSSAIGLSRWDSETLVIKLAMLGGKFKRIDFAFDDKVGLLDMGLIGLAVRERSYVSRSKSCTHYEKHTASGMDGETWAFGSRSSETYLRIYDKAAEQQQGGHWIRVELELKDERANAAVGELLAFSPDEWSSKVASWLYAFVDFKLVDAADHNRSRWLTVDWWQDFLGQVRKSKIFTSIKIRSVQEVFDWVEKQVAPSMYVLWRTFGMDELHNMILSAQSRLRDKHLSLIAEGVA